MSKSKVKVKVGAKSKADKADIDDLSNLLAEATNPKAIKVDTIMEKLIEISTHIQGFTTFITTMRKQLKGSSVKEIKTIRRGLLKWVRELPHELHPELVALMDKADGFFDIKTMKTVAPDDFKESMRVEYDNFKESELTATYVDLYNRLLEFKVEITRKTCTYASLVKEDFEIMGIQLEFLYTHLSGEIFKDFMFEVYKLSKEIYKFMVSPDINIEEVAAKLVGELGKIRGMIPRCDLAFDAIENSLSTLKDNFHMYFADFKETNNPVNLFDGFFTDLVNESGSSKHQRQLMAQFGKITQFIAQQRKRASEQGYYKSNPDSKAKEDKLFGMLNKVLSPHMGKTEEGEEERDSPPAPEEVTEAVEEEAKPSPAQLKLRDVMAREKQMKQGEAQKKRAETRDKKRGKRAGKKPTASKVTRAPVGLDVDDVDAVMQFLGDEVPDTKAKKKKKKKKKHTV